MFKLFVCALATVSLTACGKLDQMSASITGYSKVCVEGVSYLQFPSGVTVQVDKTGKPISC
mgnify:FL=1